MRILFAGSPGIAVPSLEALVQLGLEDDRFPVAGVLTNPDTPRGRHGKLEPTDIAAAAGRISADLAARGKPPLAQLKFKKLDGPAREAVAALKPEILVSFAYGQIFDPHFLSLFPQGGINIHPSLLPRYRGATPIPAAILGRERETGITIQRLAVEKDAGDILAQDPFPLNGRETTASLSETVAVKSAGLLMRVIRGLALDRLEGRRQNNDEATYCDRISKADGLIDWYSPAADIDAKIRAYTPWPLCWTFHGEELLYILEGEIPAGAAAPSAPELPGTVLGMDKNSGILVQTGDGVLAVRRLQYRARKALLWRDFLNGTRDFIGVQLSCGPGTERPAAIR